jgi:deoxyribodipyrimidine photolyase-related protein
MRSTRVLLILGNQLFPIESLPPPEGLCVFMAEDVELCTYFRFHKHKIVLFLSAMRAYAAQLRQAGYHVDYVEIDDESKAMLSYEQKLADRLMFHKASQLVHFEIEDKFFETRISAVAAKLQTQRLELLSPMFLTSRLDFNAYLKRIKKPFMKTFYEWRRRELDILMNQDGTPFGGKFSFDEANRSRIPESVQVPPIKKIKQDPHVAIVAKIVARRFADHPGEIQGFWLPVTREQASDWLDDFLARRLADFGPYEDALTARDDLIFHSALAPALNMGLLTPAEVVSRALSHCERHNIPLNSLEGFLRQVIGWREFVRGIYRNFSESQDTMNFFGHSRRLAQPWYVGDTGIAPLDDAIKKTIRLGWAHHIERLMVINGLMLLAGIDPREVHRWFMEMYVDSSDWVMGPNVYGMGQFSDGGIFATKPYICGSNYILKMSDYKKGPWCDEWDGLYWRFVAEKAPFLKKNPRLSMMVAMWDKKTATQKRQLLAAADRFISRNCFEASQC